MNNLAQLIKLKPSPKQELVMEKACGIARYTYNWALSRWKVKKSEGVKFVKLNDLKKEWNQVKPKWVYEAPKDANQQPFSHFYDALSKYYKKETKFPKYKKKGKCPDSFYVSNDKAKITDNYIRLPLMGKVKMIDTLRYPKKDIKIMSFTVSRKGNDWYVSVAFEISDIKLNKKPSIYNIIGLDVGLTDFTVDSNNVSHKAPKPYKKNKQKLKRLQRSLSRKRKGSKNRIKAIKKVRKLHQRISNIRKDFLHKLSKNIVVNNKIIAIENLNIRGLLKNHKLASAITDVSWGEFGKMLEYKAKLHNSIVLKIDQYAPSTKACSGCCNVKKVMNLSEREYVCNNCGLVISRDYNAAINILAFALYEILLPCATRELTPAELVFLAQKAISELNNDIEASFGDNQSFIDWLGKKVIACAITMKSV